MLSMAQKTWLWEGAKFTSSTSFSWLDPIPEDKKESCEVKDEMEA